MLSTVAALQPKARDRSAPASERPDWLDYEEFPFESRAVELDGHRVHYVDEGTGPTLAFVHAGPAWSFVFRDVIKVLHHDYRCVALDFPGTGLSEAADDYEPTVARASAVFELFVEAVGLEGATLVLHDIGGPVALGVAARRPTLFDGFVVMGSFGWPLADEFPDIARFIRLASGRAFGFVNGNLNLLIRLTATKYGVGRRLSKAGRRIFRAPYRSRRRRQQGLDLLGSAVESEAYLERLERALETDLADQPTLLLFGEHDEGRKAGFQARWEALYPDARSAVVEGANHFPMADAPQFVAATIDDWYQERVA